MTQLELFPIPEPAAPAAYQVSIEIEIEPAVAYAEENELPRLSYDSKGESESFALEEGKGEGALIGFDHRRGVARVLSWGGDLNKVDALAEKWASILNAFAERRERENEMNEKQMNLDELEPVAPAIEEVLDIGGAIENAFERQRLILDGEPWMFKLYKQERPGGPSAFDACETLAENEKLFDLGAFWAVMSDDLGEAIGADIIARPAQWVGTWGEDKELHIDFDDPFLQGELQSAIERFLSDFIEPLNYCELRSAPSELLDEFLGAHDLRTLARLEALGDYRTSINQRDFDNIEPARDFVDEKCPWMSDAGKDFAAIMLATSDREGFRFSTETFDHELDEDRGGEMDPIFDIWMGLA